MLHIHKKIHHHLSHTKKKYVLGIGSTLLLSGLFVGVFFVTRGNTPYMSELAITEHSILGTSAGSVLPASGESYPVEPTPTGPGPTTPTGPGPTGPGPTEPTGPGPTTPGPTGPGPTTPGPTTPEPTGPGPIGPGPASYGYESYGYESYPSYPTYTGPSTISTFSITPRSVERGGLVSISWSIFHPNNSCKITAVVQKPATCDASCIMARDVASSTLNTVLASGTTNANDPNGGNRTMANALGQALNNPSGYAKGVKSISLDYSTTFTVSCGTTTPPFKSIIYVTNRVEG